MIRLNGVPITVITPRPALCRPLLTDNVRTASLITNNVKKTDRGLVGKPDMSILVLRGGCIKDPNSVSGILLMALVVPLRLRPVVPATMP